MSQYVNKQIAVSTEPASEPVELASFKAFLKVDGDADDTVITSILKAARIAIENFTNRPIITTGFTQVQDNFEYSNGALLSTQNQLAMQQGIYTENFGQGFIKLLKKPVTAITSIKTYDGDGTASTLATSNYTLDAVANRVLLNDSITMPSDVRPRGGVEVIYEAGYALADVPEVFKTAIYMYGQSIYDANRPNANTELVAEPYTMPEGLKQMMMPYRVHVGLNG